MFQAAQIQGSYLRLAMFGPPGSGKSFTSLRIASGLIRLARKHGGRIAAIDSERGRLKKYAGLFKFDLCDLTSNTLDEYMRAITFAAGKYDVLIIDSISHAWKDVLAQVDRAAAKAKNSFQAWGIAGGVQEKFTELLMTFPGHVIATMRSTVEYTIGTTDSGKMRSQRVGLKPIQGKEIEYEFDLLLEMDAQHNGTVVKDNSNKFQDCVIERPGEDFGEALARWLNDQGEPPAIQMRPASLTTPLISQPTPTPASTIPMTRY